jgi:uncharacterized membrane protein
MWYFITILSGFCMAAADALTKKVSGRADALLLAWVREAYALPFLLPLLFFIKIPELDATFWIAMAICVAMAMISTVLYMRAIQVAPLSLTVPYLGLTPIFLLIIPSLVLGEQLTPVGILGVILVALGTYTLQLNRVKSGWLEPWLAIFKNRGSFYMLIVAICSLLRHAWQTGYSTFFTVDVGDFLFCLARDRIYAFRAAQIKRQTPAACS